MPAGSPTSINRTARVAGALYLAMAPFGFFGALYVPSALVVPGEATATARNIVASERLFRSGTVSHLIGQIIFVFLVLALYRLLKVVSRDHAVLMVVLALIGIPVAFLNEVNHYAALRLLTGAGKESFTPDQIQSLAMLFLDVRACGITVAQIFWGLWLLPLGWLVVRSRFLPRLIGILLVIAGLGYLIDSATELMLPGRPPISQFTFVGELLFPLWLLIRGVNVTRWREASLDAAGCGA